MPHACPPIAMQWTHSPAPACRWHSLQPASSNRHSSTSPQYTLPFLLPLPSTRRSTPPPPSSTCLPSSLEMCTGALPTAAGSLVSPGLCGGKPTRRSSLSLHLSMCMPALRRHSCSRPPTTWGAPRLSGPLAAPIFTSTRTGCPPPRPARRPLLHDLRPAAQPRHPGGV